MKINLKKMLLYFEDEELMEIYEKIAESPDGEFEGVTVHDIPTLIDDVDELFFRAVEMGKDISEYLPYVSDEGFHKLIEGCVNDKYDVNLDDIYPFLPEEELKLLLKKLLNK